MTDVCPTCGQPMPVPEASAEERAAARDALKLEQRIRDRPPIATGVRSSTDGHVPDR